MLQNTLLSLVRTWVPIVVGSAAAWLAAHYHFVLSAGTQEGVTVLAVGGASAGYYLLARLLEQKLPKAGWLLGHPAKPNYAALAADAAVVVHEIGADIDDNWAGPDPLETDTGRHVA